MSVKKLEKIKVFGALKEKEKFFDLLQQQSIAHLIQENKVKSVKTNIAPYIKKLDDILTYFVAQANESFLEKNALRLINEKDFLSTQSQVVTENLPLIDQLFSRLEVVENAKKELLYLETQKNDFFPWRNLSISFEQLKKPEFVNIYMGSIKAQDYHLLEELKINSPCDYEIIEKTSNFVYMLLTIVKKESSHYLNLVKNLGFEEINLPIEKIKIFKEEYSHVIQEIEKSNELIKREEAELLTHLSSLNNLRLISDCVTSINEKEMAYEISENSKYLFVTNLFVAKEDLPLIDKLMETMSLVSYEITTIEDEEEIPALIRNNKYVKSFEFVTEMYSLPSKNDVDPTPYYAPFFPFFMGMCLSDVGPGLVLMLVALFAVKKLNIDSSMKKLMGVCFYGGLWGIFFGILTGTYFAIPFESFGISVFRLYEPSRDVLFTLGLSVAFGYIHVLLAFFVQFYSHWVHGNKSAAMIDSIPKIVVMVSGLMFILSTQFQLATLKDISIYLFFGSIIMICLTSGRNEGETVVSKLLWGAYGVYDLTGIFGDLLSYARLFALGLSGGIIANAINVLTPRIIESASFDGILSSILAIVLYAVFIIILIFGHIFVMALAFLSSFIHTMRLQFVEFFSKFFEGGSMPFKPLAHKLKYYQIRKNKQSRK